MSKGLFNSKPLHIGYVDSFEIKLEEFLELIGVERDQWSFIGSIGKKEFSTDVDVAVIDKGPIEEWIPLFKSLNWEYKIVKGFNQISFAFPFENQKVQVDFMLTSDLDWSKFIYYAPDISKGESQFPGIYRNLLLSSLIITTSRTILSDGDMTQTILRLNEGLVRVKKTFKDTNGNITKTPRIIDEKFLTNDPDTVSKICGLKGPIMTFEDIWSQITDTHKFGEIKERFEKLCKQSKLQLPWEQN